MPMAIDIVSIPDRDLDNILWEDDKNVSEDAMPIVGNATILPDVITQPLCQWVVFADVGDSSVRFWDIIILIPNGLFLIFLLIKARSAIAQLRNTSSPIFLTFYGLVCLVSGISCLRCIVSMTVNASVLAGDITDKVLWLILRFFLLATEMSVVVFGLAFGHLDSRTSIQRVLFVTFCIALIYSSIQGTLEFLYPDQKFNVSDGNQNFEIFAHGGMIFWFSTSLFFYVVYTVICILPYTKLSQRLALPSKKSFYYYCVFLSLLNLTQSIGSALIYFEVRNGLCVVDATAYVYFAFYDPLVYAVFLKGFFVSSQPSILFSYKHHIDDEAPEVDSAVNMPHQSSFSQDPDMTRVLNGLYGSTHFHDEDHSDRILAIGGDLDDEAHAEINGSLNFDSIEVIGSTNSEYHAVATNA